MTDDDLSKSLQSMAKPTVLSATAKSQIRFAVVNTRMSSRIGLALVLAPGLFVGGAVLHYGFGIALIGFDALERLLIRLEHQASAPFVVPLILVGAPLVAFVLNMLAVLHVEFDRRAQELRLYVKLRYLNLLIAGLSLGIMLLVLVHAFVDK
jgi:hypothetical protein